MSTQENIPLSLFLTANLHSFILMETVGWTWFFSRIFSTGYYKNTCAKIEKQLRIQSQLIQHAIVDDEIKKDCGNMLRDREKEYFKLKGK